MVPVRERICQLGQCRETVCLGSMVYCAGHLEEVRERKGVKQENIRKIVNNPYGDQKFRHNFPLSMRPRKR